ncbi:hypothetical protein AB833_16150 [Chromatiales bacterium (ex Bugula neritina AB1)]|nr:hypothetical protein AB833_16150 [Chromatiales bacterium (ex Bugula neritina AB1)]
MHPQSYKTSYLCRLLGFCAILSVLGGCDGSAELSSGIASNEQITVSLPERIRNAAAVDLNAVQAVATVNGEEHILTLNGGKFQASISVPSNTSFTIRLDFSETLPSGISIVLASYQENISVAGTNQTVEFFDSDYNTNFDNDGDGFSNIAERELNTDPLTFSNTPTLRTLDVEFNLPSVIPDPLVTQVIATFSGVPRAVRRTGNRFEVAGSVATGSEVAIEVILLQQFNNQRVILAVANQTLDVGVNAETLQLDDSNFDFDQDPDGDGRINIDELQAGTNPFVRD